MVREHSTPAPQNATETENTATSSMTQSTAEHTTKNTSHTVTTTETPEHEQQTSPSEPMSINDTTTTASEPPAEKPNEKLNETPTEEITTHPSDETPEAPVKATTIPDSENTAEEAVVLSSLRDQLDTLRTLSGNERLDALGIDLSKYPMLEKQPAFREIVSKQDRGLAMPVARIMTQRMMNNVPNPMMLTHILTTTCNYLCSFCSFSDTLNSKPDTLSLSEIEQTYSTIGNNLNVIIYSGGETTLNKDLPEIVEAAYQRTPVKSVYIISNAWKPELVFNISHQIMQRCPGLHLTWSLSIEGFREHNNKERRTHAKNWDAWQNTIDSMEGLKHMRERFGYKELNVQLCSVCSPDNLEMMDDWYEMVRDVLKPDKWNLNLMRKSVQMSDHDMLSFDERRKQKTLEPFEQKYIDLTQRVKDDVLSGKLKFLYLTASKLEGSLKSAADLLSQESNRNTLLEDAQSFDCLAGEAGAYIASNGDVSGCEEFAHHPTDSKIYGNLRDVGYDFQTLWRNAKADEYRQKVNCATECNGCTLESQRNYPAILVSPKALGRIALQANKIK